MNGRRGHSRLLKLQHRKLQQCKLLILGIELNLQALDDTSGVALVPLRVRLHPVEPLLHEGKPHISELAELYLCFEHKVVRAGGRLL